MIRAMLLWVLLDSYQEIYPWVLLMIKRVGLWTYTILYIFDSLLLWGPSKGFHDIFTGNSAFSLPLDTGDIYSSLLEPLPRSTLWWLLFRPSSSLHINNPTFNRILSVFLYVLGNTREMDNPVLIHIRSIRHISVVVCCCSPQNFAYFINPQNVCDMHLDEISNIAYSHKRIHLFTAAYSASIGLLSLSNLWAILDLSGKAIY